MSDKMKVILEKIRQIVKENKLVILLEREHTRKIHLDNGSTLEFHGPDGEVLRASDAVGSDFIRGYARILETAQEEEELWISELRARGICGAHPDDGHVDRERNLVVLMYPQFWDPCAGQGDKIALGWPWSYRIVRLQEAVPWKYAEMFLGKEIPRFRFEEVKEDE